MLKSQELNQLQARKAQLIAVSDLQRRTLAGSCGELREKLAWIEVGVEVAGRSRPVLALIAPIAGFLLARGWRKGIGFASMLTTTWTVGRQALRLWKNFREGRASQ